MALLPITRPLFPTVLVQREQLAANWQWYLALGIGLVVLGTLGLIYAFWTTLASIIYLGVMLLFAGALEIIQSFRLNKWGGFFLHLILGLLYGVAGVFIISSPLMNAIALTALLSIVLITMGFVRVIVSLTTRFPYWGWVFFNGVLSMLLGWLIWRQWPVSGLWIIGAFVSIDVIISGWSWIMLALTARSRNRVTTSAEAEA